MCPIIADGLQWGHITSEWDGCPLGLQSAQDGSESHGEAIAIAEPKQRRQSISAWSIRRRSSSTTGVIASGGVTRPAMGSGAARGRPLTSTNLTWSPGSLRGPFWRLCYNLQIELQDSVLGIVFYGRRPKQCWEYHLSLCRYNSNSAGLEAHHSESHVIGTAFHPFKVDSSLTGW